MRVLTQNQRRIYRLYLPLTLILLTINSLRLGFFSHRSAKGALIGLYRGFPGRNGDHMYYTSMALSYTGKSLTQATALAAKFFPDYPLAPQVLLHGYLGPGIATLIYPRQVLTQLLAWGYTLFGSAGFGLTTLLIGLATAGLLLRWILREWGINAAWIATILISGSSLILWYSTGLFIESPLLLLEVVLLYSLPISRSYRASRYWTLATLLTIILMGFTRQSPLLPLAILFGGYLNAYIRERRIVNTWFRISLWGSLVAVGTYLLTNYWAPYTPVGLSNTRHPSLMAAAKYCGSLISTDPVLVLALILAFFGARAMTSKVLPWIGIAVAASCAVNIYLATGEFRYWAPLFIFVILGATYFITHRLKSVDLREIKPLFPYRAVFISALMSLAIAISTFSFYGSSDGALRVSTPVSSLYPASHLSGSIGCYGPEQRIYLIENNKKIAALDGTAMSANPGMQNQLSGLAHGLTFDALSDLVRQCADK